MNGSDALRNALRALAVAGAVTLGAGVGTAMEAVPQGAAAVAACDAVAAHPDDPDKVGPGHVKAQIDLPAAIGLCRTAVTADPGNLRIRYQLARMLFYSGEREESLRGMKSAADDGYRQAQFVYGVFINYQRDGAPKDLCLTEAYWQKSALAGRQAARVNYVRERLNGRFKGCPNMASVPQMQQILTAAAGDATNYYESLFIKDLTGRLEAGASSDATAKKQGSEPVW